MSSIKERQQRAAARAKLEREMAARKEAAARKRKNLWIVASASAAVLVVAAGVLIAVTVLRGDDDETTTSPVAAGTTTCAWTAAPDQGQGTTVDVGMPPASASNVGKSVMSVTTNFGVVDVTLDKTKSPCAVESFTYLSGKKFFDGTKCHRMFPGMLQCGDPSAKGKGYRETDGTGGPAYRYSNEYLPTTDIPPYPAGVVALANSGADGTNGSQFFFIYEDTELSPDYTIIGKVSDAGLAVLKKATEKGHDGAFDPSPGGGHPKEDINIQTVTVAAA
ncbi:peptidylprolyl isomerase [Catenuloplanes indicus]|uniref:Peptidyl-prolyl cis-trans isomerase B (Cyclophilin B) n=1 Tax=Catenuloplanes indicus TaxID=137267 RepID=A0AAE3W5D5_9ACTN|nr:peptidylprolyl isomerase [Catenuloplanes indicus]MDQ0369861.1 peptidyl-prolyl cis-trans isomerase B (cyclophilin B) [Catenuloplanes indicus]